MENRQGFWMLPDFYVFDVPFLCSHAAPGGTLMPQANNGGSTRFALEPFQRGAWPNSKPLLFPVSTAALTTLDGQSAAATGCYHGVGRATWVSPIPTRPSIIYFWGSQGIGTVLTQLPLFRQIMTLHDSPCLLCRNSKEAKKDTENGCSLMS